mmetsp:Transcript_45085/g.143584  ORF Transcript_45085/g.143584 Transcript_45085/m.143584 type:complete len:243 (-) Transcript_45085:14-742(-)
MPVLQQGQGDPGLLRPPLQVRGGQPADEGGAQVERVQEGADGHGGRAAVQRLVRDHERDPQGHAGEETRRELVWVREEWRHRRGGEVEEVGGRAPGARPNGQHLPEHRRIAPGVPLHHRGGQLRMAGEAGGLLGGGRSDVLCGQEHQQEAPDRRGPPGPFRVRGHLGGRARPQAVHGWRGTEPGRRERVRGTARDCQDGRVEGYDGALSGHAGVVRAHGGHCGPVHSDPGRVRGRFLRGGRG